MVTAGWVALGAAPFIGSLLGVLIRRLPAGRPVALARSACDGCGRVLAPRDLVPVVSYAWLRGRCRTCGAAIGRFHLSIELAALLVPISLLASGAAAAPLLAAGCALGWTLLALGWIDAETFLLPDALTLPLVVTGLAEAWWLDRDSVADRAAAAIVGYLALRLVGWLYRMARRRDGLGLGDAKLLAAAGAWLGLGGLAPVLLIAAALGLAMAGAAALRGAAVTRTMRLPFGAPLAAAIWVVWLALG